jgi:hypothetical protein
VLATQVDCGLGCEPAERLTGGINDVPLTSHIGRAGTEGLHQLLFSLLLTAPPQRGGS